MRLCAAKTSMYLLFSDQFLLGVIYNGYTLANFISMFPVTGNNTQQNNCFESDALRKIFTLHIQTLLSTQKQIIKGLDNNSINFPEKVHF